MDMTACDWHKNRGDGKGIRWCKSCLDETVQAQQRRIEELAGKREPEPGDTIAEVHCPCCGADLEIMHGDEPGEIGALGNDSPVVNRLIKERDEARENWNHVCDLLRETEKKLNALRAPGGGES